MKEKTTETVGRLCEMLISLEGFNRETIGDLAEWFWRLQVLGSHAGRAEMKAVTKAAALLLEEMIANSEINRRHTIRSLGTTGRWFYKTAKARAEDKRMLKRSLIKTLENMDYYSVGDMS